MVVLDHNPFHSIYGLQSWKDPIKSPTSRLVKFTSIVKLTSQLRMSQDFFIYYRMDRQSLVDLIYREYDV